MTKCNSNPVTDTPEDDPIFEVIGQDDCPICGSLMDVLFHPIYLWGVSCTVCQFANAIRDPEFDPELGAWCGTEVDHE